MKPNKVKKVAEEKILRAVEGRFKKAVKAGKLDEVIVAQGMLEGSLSPRKEVKEKESETNLLTTKIDKRKSSLITSFLKPVKKPLLE